MKTFVIFNPNAGRKDPGLLQKALQQTAHELPHRLITVDRPRQRSFQAHQEAGLLHLFGQLLLVLARQQLHPPDLAESIAAWTSPGDWADQARAYLLYP